MVGEPFTPPNIIYGTFAAPHTIRAAFFGQTIGNETRTIDVTNYVRDIYDSVTYVLVLHHSSHTLLFLISSIPSFSLTLL